MIEYSPKHLVMVAADANNNKYYDMVPNGVKWTAEYGRIGGSSQTRVYSKGQWESKYKEKIRKGYVDQTELVRDLIAENPKSKSEYKPITNQEIADIVRRLQEMAHAAIEANYTISSNKVTQSMVDEAQSIINGLIDIDSVSDFNESLMKLFTTIPRKMGSVKNHIASNKEDFNKIISREQDLLDVMKGQVVQKQTVQESSDVDTYQNDKTILEVLGIQFEECNRNDIAAIKVALGDCADKFHKAWKVKNLKTQDRFDKYVKEYQRH